MNKARDSSAGTSKLDLSDAERILPPDTTLLDLLDNTLSKGVMIRAEVMLGLAGIDLVYLGLTAVLCSADRLLPERRG